MMPKFLRHLATPLRTWAYWQVMNWVRGTRVEGSGVSPRARIGRRAIVRRGSEVGANVILGDFSYISGPRSYVETAQIGKFCSIARQVVIGPGDHDLAAVTTHPFPVSPEFGGIAPVSRAEPQKAPPVIGNDVWIGMNAVILRGVSIGDGAVIAASSVVTRDVEPYTIVGGAPARMLKRRFPPEIAEALLRSRWWDWPDEVLSQRLDEFRSPENFARKYGAELQ
jgi:virginiamycin A acetyltransferase